MFSYIGWINIGYRVLSGTKICNSIWFGVENKSEKVSFLTKMSELRNERQQLARNHRPHFLVAGVVNLRPVRDIGIAQGPDADRRLPRDGPRGERIHQRIAVPFAIDHRLPERIHAQQPVNLGAGGVIQCVVPQRPGGEGGRLPLRQEDSVATVVHSEPDREALEIISAAERHSAFNLGEEARGGVFRKKDVLLQKSMGIFGLRHRINAGRHHAVGAGAGHETLQIGRVLPEGSGPDVPVRMLRLGPQERRERLGEKMIPALVHAVHHGGEAHVATEPAPSGAFPELTHENVIHGFPRPGGVFFATRAPV